MQRENKQEQRWAVLDVPVTILPAPASADQWQKTPLSRHQLRGAWIEIRSLLQDAAYVRPVMGVKHDTGLGHRLQCVALRTLTERGKTDRGVFSTLEIRDDNPIPRLVGVAIDPSYVFPANASPANMLALDKRNDAIHRVCDAGTVVSGNHQDNGTARLQVVVDEDMGANLLAVRNVANICSCMIDRQPEAIRPLADPIDVGQRPDSLRRLQCASAAVISNAE